jgi:hypothetical protein
VIIGFDGGGVLRQDPKKITVDICRRKELSKRHCFVVQSSGFASLLGPHQYQHEKGFSSYEFHLTQSENGRTSRRINFGAAE